MSNPGSENTRKPTCEINNLILNRWSPRSFTGQELDDKELFTLFEAARWTPSSYNNQPWIFIYAKRNSSHWNVLFGLLADGNKPWCSNASTLVVIISKKTFDYNGKPSLTHQFDAGAAWENLAIQGVGQGWLHMQCRDLTTSEQKQNSMYQMIMKSWP
jgi:nitroreductase